MSRSNEGVRQAVCGHDNKHSGATNQAHWLRHWLSGCAVISAAVLFGPAAQAGSLTRTSAFEYDASGLLTKEVVEPGNSDLCVVTTYALDSFGNRTSATTRNCNGSSSEVAGPAAGSAALFDSRSVSTGYSSDGRFPISNTNALSQSEYKFFDPSTGLLTKLTGPNGLSTLWAYDGFGRKVLEQRADGNGTRWKYEYCNSVTGGTATCPAVAASVAGSTTVTPAYVVTVTPVKSALVNLTIISQADGSASSTDGGDGGANGPYSKTYYDTLGRVIRTETQGFDLNADGTSKTAPVIYQDTAYDNLGRVLGKSRPYYQGATSYWVTYTYDKLDRVLSETQPDGSKTSTKYPATNQDGSATIITVVTNDKGQTVTEVRNVAGQVITIKDANGQTLSKTWDPYGNLLTTTDALGNVTKLTYDLKGRKTQMIDPDMGTWSYVYNALGELKQQTDAKGQLTTMTYDVLGRLTQKSEPSLTSNWYYDKYQADASWQTSTCTKGIGKLCEVASNNGYGRKHSYDGYGRASSTTSTIGAPYTASTTYNSDGRVDTITYPGAALRLKNDYSPLGYTKAVSNADAPTSVYWKAQVMDAEGHLTQYVTGNQITTLAGFDVKTGRLTSIKAGATGSNTYAVENATYAYDTLGNVSCSSDSAAGASATYGYDALNRLTTESRFGTAVTTAQSITWAYNEIGNITSRSDVGTYSYAASGAASVRPHAVTGVAGTVNGIASPNYSYDANGNLTSATGGRTVAWTSFNKVQSITQAAGGNTTTLAYVYDAEGDRAKETYSLNGTVQRTTIYLNPGAGAGLFYEEEITSAGTKKKHYLNAGGTTIGLLTFNTAANSWTTQYWHKDNLGSTVAVTDAMGAVTERMSYEPFGKRRKVDGTTDLPGTLQVATTHRGFTGHEMMDDVGLVNMNGRIYDPAISRFLSADPYIQAPSSLQSYNRYSYAWNNPLTFTDPTGFNVFSRLDKALSGLDGRDAINNFTKANMQLVFDIQRQLPGQKYQDHYVESHPWLYQLGLAIASYYGGPEGAAAYTSYHTYAATSSMSAAYRAGENTYVRAIVSQAIGSIGGYYGGIVGSYGAQALIGCASAASEGGSCGRGAITQMVSYGISEATDSSLKDYAYLRFAVSVVAGGISSRLAGGDFSTGVATVAFSYLFPGSFDGGDEALTSMDEIGDVQASQPAAIQGVKDIELAQLGPSLMLTEPPVIPRITPLDELPLGSAGGPGAGKNFPRSLNNQPEGTPCTYCGEATTRQPGPKQYNGDHIVPKAQGGNNTPENHAPSCRTCNLQKGNRTPQQWYLRPGQFMAYLEWFYDAMQSHYLAGPI